MKDVAFNVRCTQTGGTRTSADRSAIRAMQHWRESSPHRPFVDHGRRTKSGIWGSFGINIGVRTQNWPQVFPPVPAFTLTWIIPYGFRCVSVAKHWARILSLHRIVVTYKQRKHCFWHEPGKRTPSVIYELRLGSLKAQDAGKMLHSAPLSYELLCWFHTE